MSRPDHHGPGFDPFSLPDEPARAGSGRRAMSHVDAKAVFREAVRWELANGRLSAWRRRRIVRYAAALRITAVEAGRVIQQATRDHQAEVRRNQPPPALRCVAAPDQGWPTWAKLAASLFALVAAEAVLWLLVTG